MSDQPPKRELPEPLEFEPFIDPDAEQLGPLVPTEAEAILVESLAGLTGLDPSLVAEALGIPPSP